MPVTVEEQEPPAWKLMLLTIGCSTTSWPPAQQLWLRMQQDKMLVLQRRRDESEARQRVGVAAAALRVLLVADLAAIILPVLELRVAALGRVCRELRSAAELQVKAELARRPGCLDLIWCSMCRCRLHKHAMWEHEHAMCKQCMLHMIDTMSCNEWAEWKYAWKYGPRARVCRRGV